MTRPGAVAAPALGAGAALALSLPPWGWWPLAYVGAGIAYWRLAGLSLRRRLWCGWLLGLGCYVPGLFWARSFNWYGAVVLMAVEALSMGLAAALVPAHTGRLPAFVGAFTLLEALRLRWPFGGLPIGGVFLGQAGGPLLGLARLGGPLLLTAAVWAAGAAGAAVLGSLGRRRRPSSDAPAALVPPALLPGALVLVALVLVTLWAGNAPDGGRAQRSLRVAAVQGGGQRGLSRAQVDPATVFAAQLAATARLPAAGGATAGGVRLVVWPEDVVALDVALAASPAHSTMAALARRLDATLVAGVTVTVSSTSFRNEVVAWGPDGRVVGTFEKVHRVPFGEYVPGRAVLSHLANLAGVPRDAVPGQGSGLVRTPAGPLGLLVSYEVFYAGRARSSVRAGAQLLVVPTNTSSYATGQIPGQEVAADEVQAVATGRDLVQAAPTGYSTVVDHRGRLRRRSGLGDPQVVLATVGLRRGATIYVRLGDLPVLLGALALLAGGWATALRRRRVGAAVPRAGSERGPVRTGQRAGASGQRAGATTAGPLRAGSGPAG